MVELSELMIVLKSNRPVFSNSRECVDNKPDHTATSRVQRSRNQRLHIKQRNRFQIHDTTRNDDAHFCCVFGLLDNSEQPETHQRTGLAETAVPTTTTVLAHFSVSSDFSVRERAFQSSPRQINADAFKTHR